MRRIRRERSARTPGRIPIRARRPLFPIVSRARASSGPAWGASTTSTATATSSVRASAWRLTPSKARRSFRFWIRSFEFGVPSPYFGVPRSVTSIFAVKSMGQWNFERPIHSLALVATRHWPSPLSLVATSASEWTSAIYPGSRPSTTAAALGFTGPSRSQVERLAGLTWRFTTSGGTSCCTHVHATPSPAPPTPSCPTTCIYFGSGCRRTARINVSRWNFFGNSCARISHRPSGSRSPTITFCGSTSANEVHFKRPPNTSSRIRCAPGWPHVGRPTPMSAAAFRATRI